MPKWRYRPEGNRTPVAHPTIGHLDYDGVYDHPDCADNPDFVEVRDKKPADTAAEIEAPVAAPASVTNSPGDTPAEAGKPGRS